VQYNKSGLQLLAELAQVNSQATEPAFYSGTREKSNRLKQITLREICIPDGIFAETFDAATVCFRVL
jgi:hypothetical protein